LAEIIEDFALKEFAKLFLLKKSILQKILFSYQILDRFKSDWHCDFERIG
jgi:hypothetical protein